MGAAAKAKGELKPVPDRPRRGNWAVVDLDEPWMEDVGDQNPRPQTLEPDSVGLGLRVFGFRVQTLNRGT